jgi:hypothetical protein
MNIIDKIKSIYPTLTDADFFPRTRTIFIQNDSDGKGDYIAKWEHPTYARPTQEQLNGS